MIDDQMIADSFLTGDCHYEFIAESDKVWLSISGEGIVEFDEDECRLVAAAYDPINPFNTGAAYAKAIISILDADRSKRNKP